MWPEQDLPALSQDRIAEINERMHLMQSVDKLLMSRT